jgi:uncharacterized protein YPO0396
MSNQLSQVDLLLDGAAEQFRLTRVQTFNWGTFSGVFDFPIPEEGYLFVGPSGSGKSTVLDAHAALLTPPRWVDFNVAAREAERNGRDRSVMTYVRGAWAQQTGESGEYVSQYLRPDTTWTAIAETYSTGTGRIVVLAQVLWVRGKLTGTNDVKKLYLVLERPFEIQELDFFPTHDFDTRRFKQDLADAYVTPDFRPYQDRFLDRLGIDNERALRLLHKTQSAKNLGDLNLFLREFMLDAPGTFDVAERLVLEFGELNAAHQAVVAARKQIGVLLPASEEFMERQRCALVRNELADVIQGVEHYRAQRKRELTQERLAEEKDNREASRQKQQALARAAEAEFQKLNELRARRSQLGGGVLEKLHTDLKAAEEIKPDRLRRRGVAEEACKTMGWAMPDDVVWFVRRTTAARDHVSKAHERTKALKDRQAEVALKLRDTSKKLEDVAREVRAMERQPSNIPDRLLAVRSRLSHATGISEDKLPFVGDLLEVRPDSSDWQGSIEQVLGGFARNMLVDERHYNAVSDYLNDTNIGERLFYSRMIPQVAGNRTVGPKSLIRKLEIAKGPFGEWLLEELKVHHDIECSDTMQEFRAAARAVTMSGQIKRDRTRHEKNDSHGARDPGNWVLGFDNTAKRRLFEQMARELGTEVSELQAEQARTDTEADAERARDLACNTLQNMTWADVDVASLAAQVRDLTERIAAETAARPDLAVLDQSIATQDDAHRRASDATNVEAAKGLSFEKTMAQLAGKLQELERFYPEVRLTPFQQAALEERVTKTGKFIELETVDEVIRIVERGLASEDKAQELRMVDLKNNIERRFADFNRDFIVEAAGLDPTFASAEDYFAKLARLQSDGLPKHEERFMQLLREQSDQNLTLLASKLEQERGQIRTRMAVVNDSLLTAPFNPGTHLVIETTDRSLEDVRLFRMSLKEALSHSFGSVDKDAAEERFGVLEKIVRRLNSQDTPDKNWRNIVLDVRQHVDFVARELDVLNREVDVYRSGAGKSGGQRQKLAATCLAAALRYQLGGQDRALPSFSTVVLDEAFDKADAEFTAMAMNIFKTFGFQMVVATPLKSVMTLEPFIGGACFVHIKDRKRSTVLKIDYDKAAQRLKLPAHVTDVEEAVTT